MPKKPINPAIPAVVLLRLRADQTELSLHEVAQMLRRLENIAERTGYPSTYQPRVAYRGIPSPPELLTTGIKHMPYRDPTRKRARVRERLATDPDEWLER